MNSPKLACETCGSTDETRPYGPRGSLICFACAFASPEARQRTEEAYRNQLQGAEKAAGGGPVVIGKAQGPYPLRTKEKQ